MDVPASRRTSIVLVTQKNNLDIANSASIYFMRLASAHEVKVQQDKTGVHVNAVSVVSKFATAYIPLDELIDVSKEIERINKEIKRVGGEVARAEGKLNNQGFMSKAPEKVVHEEREKLESYKKLMDKLKIRLGELSK